MTHERTDAPSPPIAPCANEPFVLGRRFFFLAVLVIAAGLIGGRIWEAPPVQSPNDAARWDTIWSLVRYGTYQIYDLPETAEKFGMPQQFPTIDKVQKDGKSFASKPPLMPTVIAGYVYLLQPLYGEPIGRATEPGKSSSIQFYSKAVLFLFNLVPYLLMIVFYRRYLDRYAEGDFVWCYSLLAAAFGTYLTGYLVTLNNHTIGAISAFFTAYLLIGIVYEGKTASWRYFLAGILAAWSAANELPAALGTLLCCLIVLRADWRKALFAFAPGAALVTAAFFLTNYLAIGSFKPAYLQKNLYDYPGSYWLAPSSAVDALNAHPESYLVYFLNLTVGHHGIFSLTPIWIFAAWGMIRSLVGSEKRLRGVAWPIAICSAADFAFFWLVTDQRNYGGFCQGPRWILWVAGLWLLLLPFGLEGVAKSRWSRAIAWIFLAISVLSVGYCLNKPWTRSWLHALFLHFGVVNY